MTLQELTDYLTKVPDCSGIVNVMRDEFYGVQMKAEQEHGYRVGVTVKGAIYSGIGMTVEEAAKNLQDKLLKKFTV